MNPILMALLGQAAPVSPIDDAFGQAEEMERRKRGLGEGVGGQSPPPSTVPEPPRPSIGAEGVRSYDAGEAPPSLMDNPAAYHAWTKAGETAGAEPALQRQMPNNFMEKLTRLLMQMRAGS